MIKLNEEIQINKNTPFKISDIHLVLMIHLQAESLEQKNRRAVTSTGIDQCLRRTGENLIQRYRMMLLEIRPVKYLRTMDIVFIINILIK